ncbi:12057_t:CDS:2, partial [Racocetra fulgida]
SNKENETSENKESENKESEKEHNVANCKAEIKALKEMIESLKKIIQLKDQRIRKLDEIISQGTTIVEKVIIKKKIYPITKNL